MNSAPYFSVKPPVDSTLTGPARFTSPCSITILTPGCAGSVVRNTVAHSCALSIAYFSVTVMVASTSPVVGVDERDVAAGLDRGRPRPSSADSVIGIGQNRPLAVLMPSHTPCQSACVMKPSSGVKPPMPSMMMSPFSRELTGSVGSVAARRFPSASASPCSSRGEAPRRRAD